MKTTIDISDPLLAEAKEIARREHTTLRRLVEEGLRRALQERARGEKFALRRVSFKGQGLQAGVEAQSWEAIRRLAYEGRGA